MMAKKLTYDELSKWKYTEERASRADLYDTDEEAKKLIPLGCRSCRKYRPDARYKGIIGMCEETSKTTQVGMICGSYERGNQKWLQGGEVEE